MQRTINGIVIHCSASPQGRGDDAEVIHRWHRERGWSGIGYHWVILEDGTRQAGRPEYWQGSHVRGRNADTVGVCLIGEATFQDAQMAALGDTVRELLTRYPDATVYGHCDLDPAKTCPNFNVGEFIQGLYLV